MTIADNFSGRLSGMAFWHPGLTYKAVKEKGWSELALTHASVALLQKRNLVQRSEIPTLSDTIRLLPFKERPFWVHAMAKRSTAELVGLLNQDPSNWRNDVALKLLKDSQVALLLSDPTLDREVKRGFVTDSGETVPLARKIKAISFMDSTDAARILYKFPKASAEILTSQDFPTSRALAVILSMPLKHIAEMIVATANLRRWAELFQTDTMSSPYTRYAFYKPARILWELRKSNESLGFEIVSYMAERDELVKYAKEFITVPYTGDITHAFSALLRNNPLNIPEAELDELNVNFGSKHRYDAFLRTGALPDETSPAEKWLSQLRTLAMKNARVAHLAHLRAYGRLNMPSDIEGRIAKAILNDQLDELTSHFSRDNDAAQIEKALTQLERDFRLGELVDNEYARLNA